MLAMSFEGGMTGGGGRGVVCRHWVVEPLFNARKWRRRLFLVSSKLFLLLHQHYSSLLGCNASVLSVVLPRFCRRSPTTLSISSWPKIGREVTEQVAVEGGIEILELTVLERFSLNSSSLLLL